MRTRNQNGMKVLVNKKSGSPPQASRSTESNAALAVTAPPLHLPLSEQGAGVRRYADVNNLDRLAYAYIIPHTRAKVAEKGEKYGDDTHPQARENMVILV